MNLKIYYDPITYKTNKQINIQIRKFINRQEDKKQNGPKTNKDDKTEKADWNRH